MKDSSGFLWVEEGEPVVGPVATVAPIAPIDKTYSFAIPPELADDLTPGQRVNVPMGKRDRLVPGFCVAIAREPWNSTLKPIHSLIDTRSYMTPDLIELGQWISQYYACPLGRTLAALVPEVVRKQSGHRWVRYVRLALSFGEIETSASRLGVKQRAALERLSRQDGAIEFSKLLSDADVSQATVKSLEARGWIHIDRNRRPLPPPDFDLPSNEPDFELNADQLAAVRRTSAMVDAGSFRVALLYGVSGSGKTEVYIQAMRRALAAGRQVIMLVPEIALTTQLFNRLACRFQNVAVIHSGLTGVHRSLTWSGIRSGEKTVIIGTRSAVFAPCPNLGLIVVDEEQESSYKNLQAPRFHVRDVAIKRGQQLSIPVILGSATPSLEAWHNCSRFEHFERIDLPNRVRNLPMPTVCIADMADEYKVQTGMAVLSRLLLRGLERTLSRGEQAVLLLNRRGYAGAILCRSCKFRFRCPDCHTSMVYHAARNELVCHYCAQRTRAPERCPNPSCRSKLIQFGAGTERIEERLKRYFPKARIRRVDSDTMRHRGAYHRLVEEFEAREIDVLIGTQMVAKGLDFPFVSFVGVIGADISSSAPDFRAGERLFQLVTQVAGRAGRGDVAGDVVVQTMSPDSPSLRAAVRHDYDAFVADELAIRRHTHMPPFSRLARVVLSDEKEPRARDAAQTVAEHARKVIAESRIESADVLGPMPCVLTRLRKRYRYEFLIRADTSATMGAVIDRLRGEGLFRAAASRVIIDVDPVSLA